MRFGLILPIIFSLIISLYPYLINGAPFIGDSWIHIKYAREVYVEGSYSFGEYNLQWPYVNLIITLFKMFTGLDFMLSSQVIPFIAGLSVIPLYLLFKNFGLKSNESILALFVYVFFPLFSIVILTSAVMKETTAYYIFNLLLLYITSLWVSPRKFSKVIVVILSLSLVFSHHFASLAMLFVIASLVGSSIYSGLSSNQRVDIRMYIFIFTVFSTIFLFWNGYTVSLIGSFFVNNLYEVILIISFILVATYLSVKRFLTLLLGFLLPPLVYLGFRGGIYSLLTQEPPISLFEFFLIILFTSFYILGSYRLKDSNLYRGVYTSILVLFYAFLIWSPDVEGFVTFTKASHYVPIIIAPTIAVSGRYLKGDRVRKFFSISVVVALFVASSYSLYHAVSGLSAYKYSEVFSTSDVIFLLPENTTLNVDVRGGYLLKYLFDISVGRIGSRGFNLIFDVNSKYGVLLGYEWIDLEVLVPNDKVISSDRIFDSHILKLIYIV